MLTTKRLQKFSGMAAAVLLACGSWTAPAFASQGGEALDAELPSMRTPIAEPVNVQANEPVSAPMSASADGSALTRAEVRESLHLARMGNRVTPSGEIGDTPEVLAAREAFNELQTEVLQSQADEQASRLAQAPAAPQDEISPLLTEQGTLDLDVLALLLDEAAREGRVTVLAIDPD